MVVETAWRSVTFWDDPTGASFRPLARVKMNSLSASPETATTFAWPALRRET